MISGLSVLVLLATYFAVNQSAALSIASLQLNIPMAIYVAWSIYRSAMLIRRSKKVAVYRDGDSPSDKNQVGINQKTLGTNINA